MRISSLPIVTVVLSLLAVFNHNVEALNNWLVYDRTPIEMHEPWRLVTGQLTHWNADHLLWDVLMFLVLGIMLEPRQRESFLFTLVASTAAISAVLWFYHPDITQYRGLSGIDSALFAHAAILLCIDARREGRTLVCGVLLLLMLGFVAKIVFEFLSGTTLFVDSTAAGFVPLPSVHAVGGIVGALSAVIHLRDWSEYKQPFLNRPGLTQLRRTGDVANP
jgi:rhomboid family GlyGly-CTERM serine protease